MLIMTVANNKIVMTNRNDVNNNNFSDDVDYLTNIRIISVMIITILILVVMMLILWIT